MSSYYSRWTYGCIATVEVVVEDESYAGRRRGTTAVVVVVVDGQKEDASEQYRLSPTDLSEGIDRRGG